MDDLLLRFGDPVKSLGNGRVGGYLCRFSGESDPDLEGEFFSKSTDFDKEFPGTLTVRYNHGIDPVLKKRKLGKSEIKVDEVGIWIEAQLEQRDEYDSAIAKLAEEGKLGWSSGSSPHLVEKESTGKAVHILSWPLIEASLTPTPCEPRNSALPLKSWQQESPKLELVAVKATYLGPYIEGEMTMAALSRLNDRLFYGFIHQTLFDEMMTEPQKVERLRAGFTEFAEIAISTITALMGDEEATASLKTLWGDPTSGDSLPAGPFADHSQSVLAAVSELARRSRDLRDLRAKSGRVLSAANRDRLATLHSSMEQVMSDLKTLLEETAPQDDTEPRKATDLLRTQSLRLLSRVGATL